MRFSDAVEHANKYGYAIIRDFYSQAEIDEIFLQGP